MPMEMPPLSTMTFEEMKEWVNKLRAHREGLVSEAKKAKAEGIKKQTEPKVRKPREPKVDTTANGVITKDLWD